MRWIKGPLDEYALTFVASFRYHWKTGGRFYRYEYAPSIPLLENLALLGLVREARKEEIPRWRREMSQRAFLPRKPKLALELASLWDLRENVKRLKEEIGR